MGKGLQKQDLIAEIGVEKNKLDRLLENLDDKHMTESGVTPGGWAVKDILGHLIEWQQLNISWYRAGILGEKPDVPAKGFSWRETSQLNQLIFIKHKDRDLVHIRQDFGTSHQAMLDLIAEVRDDYFNKVGHFSWCGNSWSLSDYIRANTASHYRWASKHISKWLKNKSVSQSPR